MFITEVTPDAIANLWLRLRSMLARASVIVGALPALAELVALPRRRQREIASSIALLEAIARKLILIAAADLRKAEIANAQPSRLPRLEIVTPSLPRLSAGPRPANNRTTPPPFDPAQPETWRVRFKLAPPRDPLACPAGRAPRIRALWGSTPAPPQRAPSPPHQVSPAPLRLALRFEALRRVIADPAPHARRLARALPRLCRRFRGAAERYAVAVARPYCRDEGDPSLIVEAMALAVWVTPLFLNSG